MYLNFRAILAILLCEALILTSLGCGHRKVAPQIPLTGAVFNPLQEYLQKSYLELFQAAPTLEFSQSQIEEMRKYLDEAKDYCAGQFKNRVNQLDSQIEQAQSDLKSDKANMNESKRKEIHCKIQNLRVLKAQAELLASQAIPVAYENKHGKLDLIERWPVQFREIKQEIADGSFKNRQWGDVEDIGFREVGRGQGDDIKAGQEAIEQMKRSGLLPPEVNNKEVVNYVSTLGTRIAKRSDLRVPLRVTVLNSKEINAFALPGGFLFVQRGLLEAAEDESQLAGVLAHEIAHVAARHGHRLMVKATIASIFFQAAQVAAVVLTGGVAGIGTYYAIQYGFYGLGLVLSLNLLGVSREYELEADQLGIQYAWNTGYDAEGFIRFFDKMATREGYINGVSWFRTHPPFYDRMVKAEREIMFLPEKSQYIVQTTEFEKMKKSLAKVAKRADKEGKKRPSLLAHAEGCPPPRKIEYKPGQPIEALCHLALKR